ncbi:MAG: hypothetical protein BBJ60_06840 [Desulfobacterales bacterium S7086C20]|nr:MAG: hypothetical protein BBJ60_06840 [Desulfobacterales bacterium S7086C20]
MKVAVSAMGNDLNSQIDPRFGRCRYFVIVETEDMGFNAFENENAALSSSAGIQSASLVASQGVKAVLTGNCGPKAAQVLSSAGIEIITGQEGAIQAAVERFKKGDLLSTSDGNVSEKFGLDEAGSMQAGRNVAMAAGSGRGLGGCGGRGMGGGGRGMGVCGGRGMGGGMGRGLSGGAGVLSSGQGGTGVLPKENELEQLKEQAGELKKQMEKIESRIKSLE